MRPSTRVKLALAAVVIVLLAIHVTRRLRDPNVVLLLPQGDAHWMRLDAPGKLAAYPPEEQRTTFRTRVTGLAAAQQVDLKVAALRRVAVRLNGAELFDSGPDLSQWKRQHVVRLPLPAGDSTVELVVTNHGGHAMAVAHADSSVDVASGAGWDASADGETWVPAVTADTPIRFNKPTGPRSFDALLRVGPWLLPFALLGGAIGWWQPRWFTPLRLCLLLLVAWAFLIVNNLIKLPLLTGYDVDHHLGYIDYIYKHRALPLASDGWQMFQSPLYYLISAPLVAVSREMSAQKLMAILRLVPMLCGAAQVVLCYFGARYALPGRRREQCLALLIGGLLPMNIYISQSIGNEPMSGCLTALSIVLTLRYLRKTRARTDGAAAAIGGALGLALLTKVSAVLLVPVITWTMWLRRRGTRRVIIMLTVCAIVCGWYYARNVIHFGKPFVAGWEPGRIPWWQEPGYRTPGSFLRFGAALADPLYAGVHGFCDALYSTLWGDGFMGGMISEQSRPPWNFNLLSAGMLLAILPSLGIIAGLFLGLRNRCLRFATLCVAIYFAALVDLYLVVPVYSTVKATYLLGLTPVLGPLFAVGVRPILRFRPLRSGTHAMIFVWAAAAFAAYFII